MKLILSRKGFDSSAGGVPSPIFPDGRMVSLPIPDKKSVVTYGEIQYEGGSIGPLVEELTGGRILSKYRAHIDPDIARDSLPRQRGWRPIFGQTGQAQGHLRKSDVGVGDLFLFFGLFRCVERRNGIYRWAANSQPCHVMCCGGGSKSARFCRSAQQSSLDTPGRSTIRTSIAARTAIMLSI